MRTVKTRNPVAAFHPVTEQYVTLKRGDEYEDDHPIVKEFGWAFEDDDGPSPGEHVESVRIEQATKAPGEKRNVRRK